MNEHLEHRENEAEVQVDCTRGIYIPQYFAKVYAKGWSMPEDILKTLSAGPEEEEYWGAWDEFIANAMLVEGGKEWFLHITESGDLLAVTQKWFDAAEDNQGPELFSDDGSDLCSEKSE